MCLKIIQRLKPSFSFRSTLIWTDIQKYHRNHKVHWLKTAETCRYDTVIFFLTEPWYISVFHRSLNSQKLIWFQVQNVDVSSRNMVCYCSCLVTLPRFVFHILHIQAVFLGHMQAQPSGLHSPLLILRNTCSI